MDENFGADLMCGSEAIKALRCRLKYQGVIISCSGNVVHDQNFRYKEFVDAVWGKPYPDWKDGTMLGELVALFKKCNTQARPSLTAIKTDP